MAGVALLLAGCSSSSPQPAAGPSAAEPGTAAAAPAAAPCASLFAPGKQVVASGGQVECVDPDGGTQYIALVRCVDGTHLGSVSGATGAPSGWFVAPGPYRLARDVAADPGYGAAYDRCVG